MMTLTEQATVARLVLVALTSKVHEEYDAWLAGRKTEAWLAGRKTDGRAPAHRESVEGETWLAVCFVHTL